jgi:hypothetical protein
MNYEKRETEMKKTMLVFVMLPIMILSGCAKKYCFISPLLLDEVKRTVGDIMIEKKECVGRVTVNDCVKPLELIYLGRTHPGNYIKIASRVGRRTQVVTEVTYPENSKFIDFQDAKIEVIEASDNWIRFKLISISTAGCDKVNGQDIK